MTEDQMEQIIKRNQENAEQEDLLFYSCPTAKDYTAYVKKRLKNYGVEEKEQVLRQTEALNNVMDELEGHVKLLLKDQERFYYRALRTVNNADEDMNGTARLAEISGGIEIIDRDDGEGDEYGKCSVALLDVVLIEPDKERQEYISIEVASGDGTVGPFSSVKDSAVYLVNLVYFLTSPRLNEHESHDEYGLNPTYH